MSSPPVQPNGGQPANQQDDAAQQQPPPTQPIQPTPPIQPTQSAVAQPTADAALIQQNAALQQQNALLQAQLQQIQAQATHPIRMKELKLPEPKEYQGTRDRTPIRMWLKDVEEIFIIGGIPPDHRTAIAYAAHYLATEPKTWYKMHESIITTWQQFKDIMINRYTDPREVDKLRQKLASIRQLTSVDSYTVAFDKTTLELTEAAGYVPREEELLFLYREGLKTQIKTIVVARGTITSLKALQETALEIDAALYAARTPLKYDPSPNGSHQKEFHRRHDRSSNNYDHESSHRQHTHRYTNYSSNSYRPLHYSDRHRQSFDDKGYAPMDTSYTIRQTSQPRLVDNKQDKPKSTCFSCGMPGHYARDCKKQPKQQQRANVIMQEANTIVEDSVLIINEPVPSDKLMAYSGLVDLYSARILIDYGATTNYISKSFVKQHDIYIEESSSPLKTKLANGTTLNIKHTAPDLQVHIQDYIDDISANVIPLVNYDMILGISWLVKHGATIDHASRTITFNFERNIIKFQPDTTTDNNTTSVDETPLIKDDQLLKTEVDTHGSHETIPVLATTPPDTAPRDQLSSIITMLFFILVLIILSTIYAWYSTADYMVQFAAEYSSSSVSSLPERLVQPKFNELPLLFHSTVGLRNAIALTYILLYICIYLYEQHAPPVYSSTPEKALEHCVTVPEYKQPKSKKARPR